MTYTHSAWLDLGYGELQDLNTQSPGGGKEGSGGVLFVAIVPLECESGLSAAAIYWRMQQSIYGWCTCLCFIPDTSMSNVFPFGIFCA